MSYIVFEGPDFAGKSTLTKKVAERLGYRLVVEPFIESENGKAVKNAIINNTFNKETEIFLLAANRLEAFREVITPHRDAGVIADRSVVSTMVYQVGEGVYNRPLNILNFMAGVLQDEMHDIYPDRLFFLDIDHDTYLERLAKSERVIDEKEKALMVPANWMKLKEDYITAIQFIAQENPETQIHFITPDVTVEEIVAMIDPTLVLE
jgi:dTMP kinase